MSSTFDIIEYMSGLTGFLLDKAVLTSIALERGVLGVLSFDELDEQMKDLLRADILYAVYLSPTTTASMSHSHGSYTKSDGAQNISMSDKERIYGVALGLYRKWNDTKLEELVSANGTVQFLNPFDE